MAKKIEKKKASKKVEAIVSKATGRKYVTVTHGIDYWKPEVGETIEGTFIETLTKKVDKDGKFDPKGTIEKKYAVIENLEGKQIGMPSTYNMEKFFSDMKTGEFFQATFNGKKKIKGGRSVNDYTFAKEMK